MKPATLSRQSICIISDSVPGWVRTLLKTSHTYALTAIGLSITSFIWSETSGHRLIDCDKRRQDRGIGGILGVFSGAVVAEGLKRAKQGGFMELDKNGEIKITENDVKQQIRGYLRFLPECMFWHNLQGLGCHRGLPDYEGVYCGRHFYIEAKSPRGKQRPDQITFQAQVESHGEMYILADNLNVVIAGLSKLRG